jgi:glycosyltransferase involved in cell wall biosynthesis
MQEVTQGRRVGIIPGKTYEYIAARKPILAAIPDGDARELLLEAGNATICSPSDVNAMAEAIAAQVRRKRRGENPVEPSDKFVMQLEWRRRSAELARLFNVVVGQEQSQPQKAEAASEPASLAHRRYPSDSAA